MRRLARLSAAALAAAATTLAVTPAPAAPAMPAKAANGQPTLQAADGRSLYVYDNDTPGQATCTGECAKLWPPFLQAGDEAAAGDWTLAARPDGVKQWMYKGRALYLFARDTKAGDANGVSFNGNKWHLAQP